MEQAQAFSKEVWAFFIMKQEELVSLMGMSEESAEALAQESVEAIETPIETGEEPKAPEATEQPTETPQEEPKKEEGKAEEEAPVAEISEERLAELMKKDEEGELTEEEIKELNDAGYEQEEPDRIDELKAQLEAGEEIDYDELSEEEVKALEEAGYQAVEVSEPVVLEDVEREVLSSLNENLDFEDPDAVRQAQVGAMKQFSQIVSSIDAVASTNPEAQAFLTKLITQGENFNFMTEMAIALGNEDLAPQPGEEGFAEYEKARIKQEFEQEQAKKKAKERNENLSQSQGRVKQYFQDNKVPMDRQQKILDAMNDYVIAFNQGNIDKYIDVIAKGLFRDQDIETETTKATVKAKNRQWIQKRKQVSKPQVKSSNVSPEDDSAEQAYVNAMLGLT